MKMAIKMETEIRWVHVLRLNRRTTIASATDREILREREREREREAEIKNLKLSKMNFIVK